MFEFLSKFEFLNRIFRREESRKTAKERLRLVLIHDRASVSPHIMEALKEDLINVISKYMEIDIDAIEMGLERKDGSIALAANIPVLRIRRISPREEIEPITQEEKPASVPAEPIAPMGESPSSSPAEAAGKPSPVEATAGKRVPAPRRRRRKHYRRKPTSASSKAPRKISRRAGSVASCTDAGGRS